MLVAKMDRRKFALGLLKVHDEFSVVLRGLTRRPHLVYAHSGLPLSLFVRTARV